MKALVLSGGGSKGSFTGGMVQFLSEVLEKDYDIFVASSTGTMLQTLASLKDFESLKKGYTEINMSDIYKVSPLKKPMMGEEPKIDIVNAGWMHFVRREPTFGDNSNLIKTLKRFFPKEKYLKSLEMGKNIVVCVVNLSKGREEYYSSQELGPNGYEEFIKWSWISTSAVPFTLVSKVNGDYYADGGIMEHMPIQKAIDLGASEIDALSTKTKDYSSDTNIDFGANPLKLLERVIDVMMFENFKKDIDSTLWKPCDNDVKINIYYTPTQLTNNSMYFDKEQMSKWWDDGYNFMKEISNGEHPCCQTIHIKKDQYDVDTLTKILEKTTNGFWDWDIETGYEYMSPKFKSELGYEDHELENKPEAWQAICDKEDMANIFAEVHKHFKTKGQHPVECIVKYKHKNGEWVKFICKGEVIEWTNDGKPVRMVGTHTKIG